MGSNENKTNEEDNTVSEKNQEVVPVPENNLNIIEEYELLDSQMDGINSALDVLEQKNDDILEKLKELLKSNIEIREQIKQENSVNSQK